MSKKESIENFLASKKIAIAGVSSNQKKFGYIIFKELREKGFDVCPINPKLDSLDGVKSYKSVSEIPPEYEKLFIVTPKEATDEIIIQAADKGIDHVWIQQMANTKDSSRIAKENNIELIEKECIFMYAQPVKSVHKFHRAIWKIFGLIPK